MPDLRTDNVLPHHCVLGGLNLDTDVRTFSTGILSQEMGKHHLCSFLTTPEVVGGNELMCAKAIWRTWVDCEVWTGSSGGAIESYLDKKP